MIELRTLDRHTAASQLLSVHAIWRSSAHKRLASPSTVAEMLIEVKLVNNVPSTERMICELRRQSSPLLQGRMSRDVLPVAASWVPFQLPPVMVTVHRSSDPSHPTLSPWKSKRKHGLVASMPTLTRATCASGPGLNTPISDPDEGLKGIA